MHSLLHPQPPPHPFLRSLFHGQALTRLKQVGLPRLTVILMDDTNLMQQIPVDRSIRPTGICCSWSDFSGL